MPNPGSHKYDVHRTRLRDEYDDHGGPDKKADRAANEELQKEHPPVVMGDPDRAAGPRGTGAPVGATRTSRMHRPRRPAARSNCVAPRSMSTR